MAKLTYDMDVIIIATGQKTKIKKVVENKSKKILLYHLENNFVATENQIKLFDSKEIKYQSIEKREPSLKKQEKESK